MATPLPDICRNKHGGVAESEAANARVHSSKQIDRERIMALATARGDHGVTLHEVCGALGIKVQTASGRMAELKEAVQLVPRGDRRNGAGVFVVPKKGQLSFL